MMLKSSNEMERPVALMCARMVDIKGLEECFRLIREMTKCSEILVC